MRVRYYIDGVEINEPNNYPELEVEISNNQDGSNQSVSINNWEFGVGDDRNGNDAANMLNTYIDYGLFGGVGVFEGRPFAIKVDNQLGTVYQIFDGYLDLSKGRILCDNIIAPAVEQGKIDWLNNVVDSISPEYLYDIGKITDDDFVSVPYCIVKKQNGIEIIVTLVSVFVMVQALKQQLLLLQKDGFRAGNPFETATAVVGIILQIAFIIVLIVAIVKLLLDLFYMIIQPVKYHNGMYVLDTMRKCLDHLGLKFSSTILEGDYKDMLLIPEKFNIKESNVGLFKNVVGNLLPNKNESNGFYKGTFGDFLRTWKAFFNAKIVFDGDTMYFEKQDFQLTSPQYQLPKIRPSAYEFNGDELYSNTVISFSTDLQDRHTVQEYLGTSVQIVQSPVGIRNKRMVLMKNLREVRLPFARGMRKTELSVIEEILDAFFNVIGEILDVIIKVINGIIQAINGIIKAVNKVIKALKVVGIDLGGEIPTIKNIESPNLQNLIDNRIDMLKMESDYIAVPKVIMVGNNDEPKNNKLLATNETLLNAKYIYENYHYFSNFVTTNGWNNQKIIKTFDGIPFTFDDYDKVRLNSRIFDEDGNDGLLLSLKWNPIKQTASGRYSIKKIYTTNIKLNVIEPNE